MTDLPFALPPGRARPKPKTTWPWLLAAVPIVFIWSAATSFQPHDPGELARMMSAPGYALGYLAGGALAVSLIPSTLVWTVLYFAVLKNSGRRNGPTYYMILLGSAALPAVAALCLAVMGLEQGQAQALAIGKARADFTADMNADVAAYNGKLAELGFADLLSPGALAADPDMATTQAKLQRARSILAEHKALEAARLSDYRARIGREGGEGERQRRLLADFDRGAALAQPLRERRWDIETRAIAEAGAVTALLVRARGGWSVSGDTVQFRRGADAEAFNRHMANLRAISEETKVLAADIAAFQARMDAAQPAR